ncbi:MAG TPA: hypothetical protein PLZ51_03685, partial [Aggregatilineales bacterium]|nr:hypothetical protein [Aggregatilineales bacterium]
MTNLTPVNGTLTAQGGTAIILSWETSADIVQIEQLSSQGTVEQVFSVTPTGQLPVTLPTTGVQTIYKLIAQRGGVSITQNLPITLQLACSVPWFFGTQLALSSSG